jgi:long-chain acyl-CoA synthetase
MEPIWLKSYPRGVASTIDPVPYQSLVDFFDQHCQLFAQKKALSNFACCLTYEQLQKHSMAFAGFLQQQCQVKPGDKVAIMMPNVLQYLVVFFAVLRVGGVVVNVNPLYTARELAVQLNDSQAKIIVCLNTCAHVVADSRNNQQSQLNYVIITELGDLFPFLKKQLFNFSLKFFKNLVKPYVIQDAIRFQDAMRRGANCTLKKIEIKSHQLALLQYTGGTTGVAKAAMLSHLNLLSNLMQIEAWLDHLLVREQEVIITALPFYHIFALVANGLIAIRYGAHNVLITNPRDIKGFIHTLSKIRFTIMTGVNTLFNALLAHKAFKKLNFSMLKLSLGGGMPVLRTTAECWQAITGKPIIEAYGLTEASPAVCINPTYHTKYNGSIGLPIPSTEILILNEHDNPVDQGQPGELCVKGPQVMQNYWQRPDLHAEKFFRDKWLRTGDIVKMDEKGFIYHLERKDDMINVSGFKVYPHEVEEVIATHPHVDEVAIISAPDPLSEQTVVAYIVDHTQTLDETTIRNFCRNKLTAYKIPRKVIFVDQLPKSTVGKVLKRELQTLLKTVDTQ